jgi:hypothetical protein
VANSIAWFLLIPSVGGPHSGLCHKGQGPKMVEATIPFFRAEVCHSCLGFCLPAVSAALSLLCTMFSYIVVVVVVVSVDGVRLCV